MTPSSLHKAATLVSGWPIEALARRTFAGVILNGRPPLRPRARANSRPAFVRSEINSPLKFGQCGEDPEHQFALGGGGVDRRTLPGEDFYSDAAGGEVVDLMRTMRYTEARKYVSEETPFLTGRMITDWLPEFVESPP